MSNLKAATIVSGNSIFTEFKGALTEQYVLQQLVLRYEPYYYAKTNSTQEIDFLLQDEEDEIEPVKEGLSHLYEWLSAGRLGYKRTALCGKWSQILAITPP